MEGKFRILSITAFILGITYFLCPVSTKGKPLFGPGNHDFSINFDGMVRSYKVHAPPSYNALSPTPLVITFHGGGGNSEAMRIFTNMDSTSNREGFIVVYPEATGDTLLGQPAGGWNACDSCGAKLMIENNNDDVGYIAKMIDKLTGDFVIDKNRIFATGHSNGAQMTFRLACELSDRIAAIAPVGMQALNMETCEKLKRPMPLILIHGTEDNCSLYDGGKCGGCFAKFFNNYFQHPLIAPYYPDYEPIDVGQFQFSCGSIPDHIERWKTINQVSKASKITYKNGDAECVTYGPDEEGEITLCTIRSLGHAWPGGTKGAPCKEPFSVKCKIWEDLIGPFTNDIIANDAMWEFFKKHPMPASVDIIISPLNKSVLQRFRISVSPNPFNSSTNINFTVFKKSQAIIDVYDLHGKIVKNLVKKHFYPGKHTIGWNGKNDAGNKVPSGIYLVKFKAEYYEQTKQILLLK